MPAAASAAATDAELLAALQRSLPRAFQLAGTLDPELPSAPWPDPDVLGTADSTRLTAAGERLELYHEALVREYRSLDAVEAVTRDEDCIAGSGGANPWRRYVGRGKGGYGLYKRDKEKKRHRYRETER